MRHEPLPDRRKFERTVQNWLHIACRKETTSAALCAEIITFDSDDWASATFGGYRHHFAVGLKGTSKSVAAAGEALKAWLSDGNIQMQGQFLADCKPTRHDISSASGERSDRMEFEALSVFE